MDALDQLAWLNVAHRIGWTLIHSLWQLAVVAALVMIAFQLLQRAKPNTRYLVACSGLLLMAILPIASFLCLDPVELTNEVVVLSNPESDHNVIAQGFREHPALIHSEDLERELQVPSEQRLPQISPDIDTSLAAEASELPEVQPATEEFAGVASNPWRTRLTAWMLSVHPLMPWLTTFWLVGVCAFAAVHTRGLFTVHRLSRLETIESEPSFQQRMETLAYRLGIHSAIRLFQTARINTPLVIGWFRPVILVPLGMAAGLPPAQVDAILLHELAHIRRHDYLVNTLQVLVESLLFYHPAVWWLSRRIRMEREYCCDDVAAAVCGSSLDLVKALAALETARLHTPLALGANGSGKEKTTMTRVRRLLEGTPDSAAGSGAMMGFLAILLFVGAAACIAMAGDDQLDKNSPRAGQKENLHEQSHARDQAEKAGKQDNDSSGDSGEKLEANLRKDLVVYYSFEDDAKGKVYDESGNGNHAVTVGDVQYEPSFRGRAPRFTSNRTYILSESPGLNMHGWKQVTVSAWIKTKRYTTYARIINRGKVGGDGASGIGLQVGSAAAKASFSVGRDFQTHPPIWEKLYSSSLEPSKMDRINKWVHLVGTFDGEHLRLYIDGRLDRKVEASGHRLKLWDRPEYKLVIGNSSIKSRMAWLDKYFDGLVDEVKIWRRTLTAGEVRQIYDEGQESVLRRQVEELSQHACRLLPETEPGVGQQGTGLDLSGVLRDSGQQRDVDAFTDDHRFFERDIERLGESKKTWALCALLDHKNVDAKILAARGLLQLADPQSGPVLLAVAKRNNYAVNGSEGATLHSVYRRTLKEALEKVTGLELTPAEHPKSTEEVDFAKAGAWVTEVLLNTASVTVEKEDTPKAIDLGKDTIRFEGQVADEVAPGLAAVGWYPVKTLPTARHVLERHRKGDIPSGHTELVGRLPVMLANFGMEGGSQLIVESFVRKGTQISADLKYIRKYPQDRVQKTVYLRAKLPQNLPPDKYHVTVKFTTFYIGPKGKHVVEMFGRPIPAMTCEFQVRGADDVKQSSNDEDGGKLVLSPADRALLEAATANDHAAVTKALEQGGDVNATATDQLDEQNGFAAHRSPTKATALHWAAYHANLPMAQRLRESGADVEAKDGRNWTPLYWSGNHDVLQFLLKQQAQVNFDQWSPLHLAANSDDGIDRVNILLKAGANPLARPKRDGRTPLHVAFNAKIVTALIDAIDDIEARNEFEQTVLHEEASGQCRTSVMKQLLAKGAKVNSRDKDNETPLHKVAFSAGFYPLKERKEAVQLLLDAGADINAENASGMTALDLIEQRLAAPRELEKGRWEDEAALAQRMERTREFANFLQERGAKVKKKTVYLASSANVSVGTISWAWMEKINQVRVGMSRAEVERLLPPHADSPWNTIKQGGSQLTTYWLTPSWRINIAYDYTGVRRDGSASGYHHSPRTLPHIRYQPKDARCGGREGLQYALGVEDEKENHWCRIRLCCGGNCDWLRPGVERTRRQVLRL